MTQWRPDPTFYPSPSLAMQAPPEELAYVALLNVDGHAQKDAIGVVDTNASSPTYGRLVGQATLPNGDNELHHFGWNACSSHLCPYAPNAHVERRYLIVPGTKSSRIHVLDTKPDPRNPRLVKVIEGEEVAKKTGYQTLHTVHCGPEGVYVNALGAPSGDGPGGIFMLDHETFEITGTWEKDRGPQYLAYDFWWHLGHDTMISSEWGTPNMVKNGVNPELLLQGKYGHQLHVWDLKTRRHQQTLDLGADQQMSLVLVPVHNPTRAYGFVCSVISLTDLSSSVFMWYLDSAETARGGTNGKPNGNGKGRGDWKLKKVITIPAEPAAPETLPPLLQGFKAVPPLITDINLSLDDRFLYVSCWGTGELRQYDVSDPFNPVLTGSIRIGGITSRAAHPARPSVAQNGGPQMIEVSRDGKRVYLTNALFSPWDQQFYPDGIRGWMAKIDARHGGGIAMDPRFFVEFPEGQRPHQVRLEGGDSTSDSFCYA
jgi:selenium-binding protein 1